MIEAKCKICHQFPVRGGGMIRDRLSGKMLKEKEEAQPVLEPYSDGPPGSHATAVAVLDNIKEGQQEQAIMAKTVSGLLTIRGIKHVTIPFEYPDDEAIYDRILAVCKKERRTPEAQILYWLDRVVEV